MIKILISNDDGVYAPGIKVLAESLREIAEITVVAPDRNRSAASSSLSVTTPLRIQELENGYISVINGSPADCVHLALTGLLDCEFDMVVSGINDGENLGDDIIYSGTVAAAMEGRYLGLPALAFSLAGKTRDYYETAGRVAKELVQKIINEPLGTDLVLNINVPDLPYEELKGFEVTRSGFRHKSESMVKTEDPRGKTIYWVGDSGIAQDAGVGTDFYAISNRKVSITPLRADMTKHSVLPKIAEWMNK